VTNSAPSTILTDTDLTYTITVTNKGPDTADLVTLTDGVPVETKFVSATPTSGSCENPAAGAASGNVICSVTSLADGASFAVNMKVKVIAKSGKTVTDTARVGSPVYDAVPGNNSAMATTTVN